MLNGSLSFIGNLPLVPSPSSSLKFLCRGSLADFVAGDQAAAYFRMAVAAILGEKGEDAASPIDVRRVDDPAPVTPGLDETRPLQPVQVKRETGGRHAQPMGDVPRGHPSRTLSDQHPEHPQPMFMGKGAERRYGGGFNHILNIFEYSKRSKRRKNRPKAIPLYGKSSSVRALRKLSGSVKRMPWKLVLTFIEG